MKGLKFLAAVGLVGIISSTAWSNPTNSNTESTYKRSAGSTRTVKEYHINSIMMQILSSYTTRPIKKSNQLTQIR